MKLKLTKIDYPCEQVVVYAEHELGELRGIWDSDTTPIAGRVCLAEVELPPLEMGRFRKAEAQKAGFRYQLRLNRITGQIRKMDLSAGCLQLALDEDTLCLQLPTDGTACDLAEGDWLEVYVNDQQLLIRQGGVQ